MKTKLLRKIRKRYSITYYPNGRYLYGEFDSTPSVVLYDKYEDKYKIEFYPTTKKIAYDKLYSILCNWIAEDYAFAGKRRVKQGEVTTEKLWWK